MGKIRTQELIGAALDWAVAKCEGLQPLHHIIPHPYYEGFDFGFTPSTNWEQGGPLIERESINIFKYNKLDKSELDKWCAHVVVPRPNMEGTFNMTAIAPDGPTPLIAAMRCYVASKLGDEVEVPDELLR